MEIRRLSDFTVRELVSLWNEGFSGYFVDLTFSIDSYLKRISGDNLSLDLSIAVCMEGKPVGFVLNGMRVINGRLTAWNGGTAVLPEFRHQGVGKVLISESLALYKREGAEVALLEAIRENGPAIALYEKMGYRVTGQLALYQHTGMLESGCFDGDLQGDYRVRQGLPQQVQNLAFYRYEASWQTQWPNLPNGESLVAFGRDNRPAGYALYKRVFDETGHHISTILYQCCASEEAASRKAVLHRMLSEIFPSDQSVMRRASNLPLCQTELVEALEQAGFAAQIRQVHMTHSLS